MVKKQLLVLLAIVSTLSLGMLAAPWPAAANTAGAQGQSGKKEPQGAKPDKADKADKHDKDADITIVINVDAHRNAVREYYSRESLPPGLAKKEALPPGLAKQLHEKGTLPPGLQKHLVPVSPDLIRRLPAVPTYYSRYFAGRDLVVVDTRTNRFVAIIRDILQ